MAKETQENPVTSWPVSPVRPFFLLLPPSPDTCPLSPSKPSTQNLKVKVLARMSVTVEERRGGERT